MVGNPRNGRPYRRLVAAVKALGHPYCRCGHNIDPGLDARSRPVVWCIDGHAVILCES
ncbi:hypothetical protein ACFYWN_40000 [Streptomyces sp. NPDC002917]|uniref:hypothetical protein n=1 Tax=Streptomyces sp. NPDC002917 TaxID=3364671 RepID=UPI0036AA6B4B